jgi:hypothetical protein
MERDSKMRSLKLMAAMIAVAALVAGPVLAQEAMPAPAPTPDTAVSAPATDVAPVKKHAKKHVKKHKKHSKKTGAASGGVAPAPMGQ